MLKKTFKIENSGYLAIYTIGFINWYLFFNFGHYEFDYEDWAFYYGLFSVWKTSLSENIIPFFATFFSEDSPHYGAYDNEYFFAKSWSIFQPQIILLKFLSIKKQKFFTWAGDFRWAELWNEAGYNPIPLASTDILSSLQTGLINTIPTMPIYALSQQSFGIANRMLNLKWGVVMAGIIIDNKTWERIPKKFHSDMILVAEKILERNQNKNREAGEKAIKVMVENGLKIYEPSIEEKRIWEQEVNKFDSLLKKELIPKDTYKKVVELIKN